MSLPVQEGEPPEQAPFTPGLAAGAVPEPPLSEVIPPWSTVPRPQPQPQQQPRQPQPPRPPPPWVPATPGGPPWAPDPFGSYRPPAQPPQPPQAPGATVRRGIVTGLVVMVVLQAATIGLLAGILAHTDPSSHPPAADKASTPPTTLPTVSNLISPTSGRVVFSSTFGPDEDWAVGRVTAHATARLTRRGYLVTGDGYYQHALVAPVGSYPSVSVTETSYLPPFPDQVGAECLSGSGGYPDLYQLVVKADGTWFAEARPSGSSNWRGPPKTLDSGSLGEQDSPMVVELVCASTSVSDGTTSTRLVGFVDGNKIVDLTNSMAGVSSSGWQPGLEFGTYGQRASVTFSRYVVRRLAGYAQLPVGSTTA